MIVVFKHKPYQLKINKSFKIKFKEWTQLEIILFIQKKRKNNNKILTLPNINYNNNNN